MANIVVMDDEAAIRTLLHLILTRAGHSVALAEDGRSGLAQVQELEPDLVITDLVMPRQEGLETITAIRQGHPRVGIIAMSGVLRSSNYLELATKLGARHVLSKPFLPEELIRAVNDMLCARGDPSRGHRFVLLDDEPAQRALNARKLRRVFPDCDIVECDTSEQALSQCLDRPVDAILADHHLRGTDGMTFMRRVRAAQIECPMVMVTNNRDPSLKDAAAASGITSVCGPDDGDVAEHLKAILPPTAG